MVALTLSKFDEVSGISTLIERADAEETYLSLLASNLNEWSILWLSGITNITRWRVCWSVTPSTPQVQVSYKYSRRIQNFIQY